MKANSWKSIGFIHRLYRRHTVRHALELVFLTLGSALFLIHFLLFAREIFSLESGAVNVLFTVSVGALLYIFIALLIHWGREGFRISTFFHLWEQGRDEVANRSSLLVYAEKNPAEIQRLGYSQELLHADDEWLRDYIQQRAGYKKPILFNTNTLVFAVIAVFTCLLWGMRPDTMTTRFSRIVDSLFVRGLSFEPDPLKTEEQIEVKRGQPVILKTALSEPVDADEAYIHLLTRAGWKTISADRSAKQISFKIPAVRQEMAYYFSAGSRLSNRGKVIPLDPPFLAEGALKITAPEYTEIPQKTINHLRPITVPEGSRIEIEARANAPIQEASFQYGKDRRLALFNDDKVYADFTADYSNSFSFDLLDSHHLSGVSRSFQVTVIPDATPAIEILHPKSAAPLPDGRIQDVQVHAMDDYRVERIILQSQLNYQESTNQRSLIYQYSPQAAEKIGAGTEIFASFPWNLTEMGLFPGDELSYFFEVHDNDAVKGPKIGRSQTYVLRYYTLTEMLDQLESSEQSQVSDLGELVEEQREITQDAQKND